MKTKGGKSFLKKVIVFAGTNEGRKICEFLAKNNVLVTACVATDYGSLVLSSMDNLEVREGRLSLVEITDIISGYDYVIDATHPYAKVVSDNIRDAVKQKNKDYLRIIRPSIDYNGVIEFSTIKDACQYLNNTSGNILVTTGSKELLPYTLINNYANRVYLRMLPTLEAINASNQLGFKAPNLICMQGPFSEELNLSILKQINAKYLITKEAGKSGGFVEKLSAAKKLGVKVILIGRPSVESGLSLEDAYKFFKKEFSLEDAKLTHFPLFISLKGRKVIIVGGGNIALRRVKSLLNFGALITVVAPEVKRELMDLTPKISISKREYQKKDLKDAFMVIATTDNRKVNQKVYEDSQDYQILVNIADKKELNNFYFPAIFSNNEIIGGLVSVGGGNHKLVKEKAFLIREFLNKRS